MVPSFAMPDSFRTVLAASPLHWCLEAYYGLFLEGGKLKTFNKYYTFICYYYIDTLLILLGLKRKKTDLNTTYILNETVQLNTS